MILADVATRDMTAKAKDAYLTGQLDAMLDRDDDAHARYCRRWPSEACSPKTPASAYREYADAYGKGYADQIAAARELDVLLGRRVA